VGSEPRVKPFVASGVITELLARVCAVPLDVEAAKLGAAARGNNQRREYAKQRGFASTIWSH